MESIEKLRKMDDDELIAFGNGQYGKDYRHGHIADEIEAEIAEKYMLLPVDADGVPIKPRDNVDTGMGDKGPVGHLEYWYPNSWVAVIEYKPGQFTRYDPLAIRHVKPRTVEDVLHDMLYEAADACADGNTKIEDCIAKYAAELRMVGE